MKILSFLRFLQSEKPSNLLLGFVIGHFIVSRCIGMFFKILISAIFRKCLQIFLKFFESLSFCYFFWHQGPKDRLQGLIISCRMVFRTNGMGIIFLMTPA